RLGRGEPQRAEDLAVLERGEDERAVLGERHDLRAGEDHGRERAAGDAPLALVRVRPELEARGARDGDRVGAGAEGADAVVVRSERRGLALAEPDEATLAGDA